MGVCTKKFKLYSLCLDLSQTMETSPLWKTMVSVVSIVSTVFEIHTWHLRSAHLDENIFLYLLLLLLSFLIFLFVILLFSISWKKLDEKRWQSLLYSVCFVRILFSFEHHVFLESLEFQPQNIHRIFLLDTSFSWYVLFWNEFVGNREMSLSISNNLILLLISSDFEPRYFYKRYSK